MLIKYITALAWIWTVVIGLLLARAVSGDALSDKAAEGFAWCLLSWIASTAFLLARYLL